MARSYNRAMPIDTPTAERIHTVWDELADFDAARPDETLRHLLSALCDLVDAQNASWLGALRLNDLMPGDPVHGWRPHCIRFLHPSPQLDEAVQEQARNLERGRVDETTVRNASMAGAFRAHRAVDLVPGWHESDYYRRYFKALGRTDVIWVGCPVNKDAECYFGIFRGDGHPLFDTRERDVVAYALRSLKWFHRQQMLAHGLLVASAPLTPVERSVLQGLLTGQSEKQIAAALDKSYHTTHGFVTGIFRKFGVNNRAALMALWLGRAI
jgi:DNA-binding CsgD family transcriptional regulator